MNPKIIRAITAILCAACGSANATPTLCGHDEQVLFNCTASKKLISVCASKDLAANQGYLQYRFGMPAKVEVTVPAERSVAPADSTIGGTMMFSGGGGAYLRFTTGDFSYAVYTAIGRGWGTKDGVAIEGHGKRIGHIACTDQPVSQLGDALFTKAGLRTDNSDFDLP